MYYAPFFNATKGSKKEELGVIVAYEAKKLEMQMLEHLLFFLKDYFAIDEHAILTPEELQRAINAHPYSMINRKYITIPMLIRMINHLIETPALVEIGFLYMDAKVFHAYKADLDKNCQYPYILMGYHDVMRNFFPTKHH